MWDWKNDRRVQAAIGVFVIVLAIKWLASDALQYAAAIYSGEITREVVDEEGFTKAVPVSFGFSTVLPLVLDVALAIVVGVGAWVINVGGWLFDRVTSGLHVTSPAVAASEGSAIKPVVVTDDDSVRQLVISMGKSAQTNDIDQLEAARIQLRLPQALDELRVAFASKDLDRADSLFAECKLLTEGPKPQSRRKASNG